MTSAPLEQAPGGERIDTRRVLAFDGMRGLGILCVIIGHVVGQYMKPVSWIDWLARASIQPLWGAIDGFFVLSGLLITGILIDSRGKPKWWRTFMLRRTLRIFPIYIAFLVVLFLVLPLLVPGNADLAALKRYQAWYWTYTMNVLHVVHPETLGLRFHQGHLWTLGVEEQFYLLWPLVVLLCAPRRLLHAALGILAAGVVARCVLLYTGTLTGFAAYVLTPFHLDGLMLGAALAVVVRTPGGLARVGRIAPWAIAVAGLAVAAIAQWRGLYDFTDRGSAALGILANAVGAAGIATVIMTSTLSRGWVARLLENRVLTAWGRYSYGIYVVHFMVLHVLTYGRDWNVGRPDVLRGAVLPSVLLLTLLVAVISFVLAMASFELYEKRFLQMGRRYRSTVLPTAADAPVRNDERPVAADRAFVSEPGEPGVSR